VKTIFADTSFYLALWNKKGPVARHRITVVGYGIEEADHNGLCPG